MADAMRILCLGAGAIGGFFGARLIEGGADVTFLVRPNRQKALAEHGPRLESPFGNFSRPVKTMAAVQGEAFDYIVLTCKAYDLASAMEDCLSRPVEDLQSMGDAGYERVVKRHSIDSEAAVLGEFFGDLKAVSDSRETAYQATTQ